MASPRTKTDVRSAPAPSFPTTTISLPFSSLIPYPSCRKKMSTVHEPEFEQVRRPLFACNDAARNHNLPLPYRRPSPALASTAPWKGTLTTD